MPELTYFRFPQPCLGWPTLYNPGLWQVTSCQTEDHRSPATSGLAILLPWMNLGNTIAWSALRVPGDLSSCNVHLLGRLAILGLWLPVLGQVLAWGRHAAWPVTESPSRTVCEPSGSPPRPRPPLLALPGVSADSTGSLLLFQQELKRHKLSRWQNVPDYHSVLSRSVPFTYLSPLPSP